MEPSQLAVPSVCLLIFFLGYPSQWLLTQLEPAPLTRQEIIVSNILLTLIWITYTQSVRVDPGTIPRDWVEQQQHQHDKEAIGTSRKWCRKCNAAKPPRAHHCKECKRCIPKMDHHCPWTSNCVSHTTFPHFLRFLVYSSLGMSLLEYLLVTRLAHVWYTRAMPAYLGPSPWHLSHLFAALLVNTITLFALGILCLRNVWCLAVNMTTIEGWEMERHRTLLRRARHFGGYLEDPDGKRVRIKRQEFPYDIGIWANVVQGMGSANPIAWLNPFAATPSVHSGLCWEVNGFEDPGTTWPPPDPDRAYRSHAKALNADAFTFPNGMLAEEDRVAAFKRRQAEDQVRRRRPFVDRLEAREGREVVDLMDDEDDMGYGDNVVSDAEEGYVVKGDGDDAGAGAGEGEEGWRNSEGERLNDFGVDEEVEFYDEQEDEIPLSELLARRRKGVT